MAINSASSLVGLGGRPLIVETLRLSARKTVSVSATSPSPKIDPALTRIQRLTNQIKDRLLEDAFSGGRPSQGAIDESLVEIARLLGTNLIPGGSDNAIFKGLNSEQIKSVDVLALAPNARADFSGGITRSKASTSVFVANASELISGGGRLQFGTGSRRESVNVLSGSSLGSLVDRINRSSDVVRARSANSRLQIYARGSSSQTSLTVTSRPDQFLRRSSTTNIAGVNSAQVTDVDLSELASGQNFDLEGTRDSVASAAALDYDGDGGGFVSGTATFDLTGRLGTVSISATDGETLSELADQINSHTTDTGVVANVVANELQFRSDTKGDTASIQISNVIGNQTRSVDNVNASQIDPFDLLAIPDDTAVTLAGSVTRAADTAQLTYAGGAGGVVVDSATFTLSGAMGSEQISITQGESLVDVRDRVNLVSSSTGIVASQSGNDLVFHSEKFGSSETISVTLVDITQYVDVQGVNASQFENFSVSTSERNSTNTINGTVSTVAAKGVLTHNAPLLRAAAEFTLTGELGSATINVSAFESVNSIRDSINDASAATGVSASTNGQELTLTSSNVGSAGIVQVDVQSGTFDTSGGDGNGNAAGTDATATINGTTITAVGNRFSYSDSLGTYTFDVIQGFTGAIDEITVDTSDGEFAITGGDGNGTAVGIDAEATINGESFVASGNDFDVTVDAVEVTFALTNGFVGAFDPITVRSEAESFDFGGGDSNGIANGQDGRATVNGIEYTAGTDSFAVTTPGGQVTLTFASDFLGAFDPIEISSPRTGVRRFGSAVTYHGSGSKSSLSVNGVTPVQEDGRYIVEQDGVRLAIEFANGFSGPFDRFSVSAGPTANDSLSFPTFSPLNEVQRESTLAVLGDLFELASGGKFSADGAEAANALSVAVEAIASLGATIGEPTIRGRSFSGISLDVLA
tara:strand:+ start:125788 stop:128565 length:2778 start_codon:yes stop_codon:yes gene_type:complete